MATEQLAYEDLEEEIPAPGTQGKFPCAYCPEGFPTSRNRYNHERSHHPQDFKRNSPDGRKRGTPVGSNHRQNPSRQDNGGYSVVTIAGVRMDSVHALTQKFAETLDNVAHDMNPGKKKQLILAFDEWAYRINEDKSLLARFLNNCGLTGSQSEYIKMILLGLDDDKPDRGHTSWGQPASGTQAYTWDPQSGRMVPAPIFLMGGPNNGPSNSMPPIMVMPGWGGGSGQGDQLTRRDMEDYIDRLVEKLKPAPPPHDPASPQVRKYQRPVVGADQKVMVDPSSGAPLMAWVEEPLDPFGDTLNKLTTLGLIGRPEPATAPSAQEIGEAVALQVQGLMPQHGEKDEEIAALRKDFSDYIHRVELKEAERTGAQAALESYQQTVNPYLEELKDLRGRTGLSDRQYELKHQEDTQRNFLGAVGQALNGLRADLQPLAIQNMVATMKAMGISDNVINETLQRLPIIRSPGGAHVDEDERASVMQKWVNE